MVDLLSLLLCFAVAYFLGWVKGTSAENSRCRRQLNMSYDEWEELWKKE